MNASRKPSIATEVHARHKRPHRLALLATSPVATGEAKIEGPQQGDGNPCLAAFSARLVASFKNQNPARGRKHFAALAKSNLPEKI